MVLRTAYRLLRSKIADRKLRIVAKSSLIKLIIGAGATRQPGWLSTEKESLNLLQPATWSRFFSEGSVDAIMAEHVWEHLSSEEAVAAAITCFAYLKKNGNLRVAVPDGYHPSPEYVEMVRPGGTGAGSDDHKILYNYKSFSELFRSVGFSVNLLEWFDENGRFHRNPWNEQAGIIRRSSQHDKRNADGQLRYTSIILDAIKK